MKWVSGLGERELCTVVRDIDSFVGSDLHRAFVEHMRSERDRLTGYLDTGDPAAFNSGLDKTLHYDLGARYGFNCAIMAFEQVRKEACRALALSDRRSRRSDEG